MATVTWQALMDTAEDMELPPPGKYRVTCTSAEHAITQNGKEMVKVTYTIDTGPSKGGKLFNNFVFSPESPQSIGFLINHIGAHGIDLRAYSGDPKDVMEQLSEDIVGCQVEVGMRHREFEGRPMTDIRSFNPVRATSPGTEPAFKAPRSGDAPPPPPLG